MVFKFLSDGKPQCLRCATKQSSKLNLAESGLKEESVMFDVIVVGCWPRGLYLCWKFYQEGKRVCYVEIPSQNKQPVTLFLNEDQEEEKAFLLSQGFLEKQDSGFCLISEQGVWSFQESLSGDWQNPALRHFQEHRESGEFQQDFLSFFARSYKSRLFEYNNSVFLNPPLNLFDNYFFFKPSVEKKKQFFKEHSGISWIKAPSLKPLPLENGVSVYGKLQKGRKIFLFHQPPFKDCLPEWQWDHLVFSGDLKDYQEIVPSHCVIIHRILLPWTHANFLSLFREDSVWDVWFRRPFAADPKDSRLLRGEIKNHLEDVFKIPFSFVKEGKDKGFVVYGGKSFDFLNKNHLFLIRSQEDLGQQLRMEEEVFCSEFSSLNS